jgi:hypothetical protein
MSGLDLRQRESTLKGGKRGPAIKPGQPDESLLYQAAAHLGELKMPPGSTSPLPAEDLQVLKKWIADGAAWPSAASVRAEPTWWAFKPPRRPAVPSLGSNSGAGNPIDAFILAKLKEKGLQPAPPAPKRTLIRRAYYDLIGLPPTPAQVDQFLKDSSPDAYEKVVDHLLASPQYGERWGRQWLDVVRYADSAGFEGDVYYPNAWRYRDYVIKSFNEDKPYDRFVQEQIAGDELWPDDAELQGFYDVPFEKLEHLEARIGTSLYTFGPQIQESFLDETKLRYEWLTDAADTTAAAFMGLTFGCARCHDHKFDPIPQKDYYRMQALFAASWPAQYPVVTGMSATHRSESYHLLIALDETRSAYKALDKAVKDRVIEGKKKDFPPEVVRAFEIPTEKRTAQQTQLAEPLVKAYNEIKVEDFLTEKEKNQREELSQSLTKTVLDFPAADPSHRVRFDGFFDVPSATVLGHLEPELIPDTYVLERGDLSRKKMKVTPGLPHALNDGSDPDEIEMEPAGPRYRKVLALSLTRRDHPLTSRVMVNRIWQGHFGGGIVRTTNDFGRQGEPPTHPELLDWLATEFVERGWSIKSMHRLIMLSRTYQMSSHFVDAHNQRNDPENLYLWRMNRRRLEAEAVWDSIHAAAGTLSLKMGGRPVMPPLSKSELAALRIKPVWVTPADSADANRRAVYIMTRRNFTFPMFDKFDRPDSSASCPARDVTNVAPQALWLLNNHVSYEQAQQFAARLTGENGDNPAAWVRAAWRIALARDPSPSETEEAIHLLDTLAANGGGSPPAESLPEGLAKLGAARANALTQLCLTVFNLNEFIYID